MYRKVGTMLLHVILGNIYRCFCLIKWWKQMPYLNLVCTSALSAIHSSAINLGSIYLKTLIPMNNSWSYFICRITKFWCYIDLFMVMGFLLHLYKYQFNTSEIICPCWFTEAELNLWNYMMCFTLPPIT